MNTNTKPRTIHTGLYGDYANEILRAVSGQLSDGMWENSRGYEKYWTNFDVERADDGETVFVINTDNWSHFGSRSYPNPFAAMSDTDFKAWYAGKLKAVLVQEFRDEGMPTRQWKRDNVDFKTGYLNYNLEITAADVYCVYDQLLGRIQRCPRPTVERVFGVKRDDAEVAAVKALREKREALIAERTAIFKDLEARREAAKKELDKKFDAERDSLILKYKTLFEKLG